MLAISWSLLGLSSDPLLLPRALTEPEVQAEQIHMHAISNTTPRFPFYVSTGSFFELFWLHFRSLFWCRFLEGFWMLSGAVLEPKIDQKSIKK